MPVGKYEVVPANWIKNIELHIEKFLNNSLNSSQKHICYWNNSSTTRDHIGNLRLDFPPDFDAPFPSEFPATGCYVCYLKKAKCELIEKFKIH